MRLAWLTDIHLDFVEPRLLDRFVERLDAAAADAVLLTGDIAQAPTLGATLARLVGVLRRTTYFVLGNHDFYRGSIAGVRRQMERARESSAGLIWLTGHGVVRLGGGTGLVGHDGWADGRLGLASASDVMLNDYLLIAEFAGRDARERFALLNSLGDAAAAELRADLERACRLFPSILVATHVPPFREACIHEGQVSADGFLPHFSSKAMGAMLTETARAHPEVRITVLCGHTHSPGFVRVLPNLEVKTGGAVYGVPEVQEIIDLDD